MEPGDLNYYVKNMRLSIAAAVFLCSTLFTNADAQWTHGRLRVTPDGHFLEYTDAHPFFWLGDTGWELFHRLTLPEIAVTSVTGAGKDWVLIVQRKKNQG
jgi:hypothetical protein